MDQWQTVYISIAFPAHLLERVDKAAKQQFISRAAYIRSVLAKEVHKMEKGEDDFDKAMADILKAAQELPDD